MRTKKGLSFYLFVMMLFTCIVHFSPQSAEANSVWPRPQIVPIPTSESGVENSVISLNGTWKFNMSTPASFWQNTVDPSSWSDIQVPGEAYMQNFNIVQNNEYPYKKQVSIPSDYNGKKVILRFEGVYSYARVWVNGNYVRDHTGGFTAWDCDITDYVTPGESAWITVGVTSKSDDISNEDQYAKHNIGGILRNVKLIALPQDYTTRLHASTDFDATYTNATLNVTGAVDFEGASNATLNLSMKDPQGNPVAISPSSINLSTSNAEGKVSIPVTSPQKWDAEHPNLYTLTANLDVGGSTVQTITKNIGFRKVVKNGNQVFVNGKEIKLRGINTHDVDPLLGRATNDELDEATVAKFADANINFIRTSHYPRSDAFLDACDKYGIYVESETAVVWQGGEWDVNPNSVSNANYTDEYMNQFSEMIEKDLSHPSIIIWSLGNETAWGINFQKELDYVKAEDPTRLTIVSWANTATDISSSHYPNYNGNLAPSKTQPTLHDEYVHVNAYNTATQQRDPNTRNFWGESIKKFWENMFPATGALGGAIWASPDEVFESPNGSGGYGEWGIIDGWRRDKPEFWLTKKAYSPIRITDAPVVNPGNGHTLNIPIKNWYDHTNFNEVSFNWSVGSNSGSITNLNIAPHGNGTLVIPARNWRDGDVLNIQVYKSSKLIDEYNLPIGDPVKTFSPVQGPAPRVSEDNSNITVSGSNFSIVFSKITGQVTSGAYNGDTIIVGGPRINLAPVSLPEMSLSSISQSVNGSEAVISISGAYGTMGVTFTVNIDGAGLITTGYKITKPIAGAKETGVIYDVSGSVDRLSWDRKGLWSAYPSDHIGRNTGVANKLSGNNDTYGVKPTWSWSQDMKDFFLYGSNDSGGRGTNDFRSQKEHIYYSSAILSGSDNRLRAESDGTAAVRMEINKNWVDDRDASITYSGTWSPYSDGGDYKGTEKFSNTVGAYAEYTFTGTGISFLGPKGNTLGTADVYIDGTLVQSDINLYAASKNPQQILYTKTGLSNGTHTIKVVVKSEYVVVDAFVPIDNSANSIAMAINNQWAYDDLDWGNYETSISVPSGYSNSVKMRLTDNDGYSIAYNPITTITTLNDNTTGTGNNQFNYVGTWGYYGNQSGAYQNDNHYSNITDNYFQVAFNGTKIQLYGAKSPNVGIAAVSIDGGAESNVDQYASVRSDNLLLYTSPTLSSGPHTLKVRVTGTKNASSTDKFITADRVDITVSGNTVNFDSKGGSLVQSIFGADTGSKITAPADPTKLGYTFAGWYLDEALTNAWDFAVNTIEGTDITLYAKWDQTVVTGPDKTPPVTKAETSPTQPDGSNGWFIHPVTFSLSVYDDLSGVADSVYSLDNGETWHPYTTQITINQDGLNTILYRSTDKAGNMEAVQTLSLNLDTSAPEITVSMPDDGGRYEDSGDLTPSFEATDHLSGVDNGKTAAVLDGSPYQPGTTIPLNSLSLGEHTFTVTTVDLAGNQGSKTVHFQTVASMPSTQQATTLTAGSSVVGGQAFNVQFGLNNVTPTVYAQDITIDYDANVWEFVSAKSLQSGIKLLSTNKDTLGKIRMIMASEGAAHAITGNIQLLELTFQAKTVTQTTEGTISVVKAILADGQGTETVALPSSIKINVTPFVNPGIPGDMNHDDKVSIGDLAFVAANYGKDTNSPDWQLVKQADVTKDGKIDLDDLVFIARKIVE